ncbi:hypothetical protein Clacol_004088 [Clathrus columnatus]|uniref:F-box domain-containing protein n=1 Tax=Clathrus columnatus TaxID=1419009 RepID=A0AAV5AAX9_9AGAM|nr:hypothetical protein Clacol_004088 [Clathrus columnatus]
MTKELSRLMKLTLNVRENNRASLMPLLYSTVCQKWRALTLEASWLWSLIIFRDDYAPYSLTRLYLKRSRLAPLIIEIDVTSVDFDPDDDTFWLTEEDIKERMSILLPHASRWRSFTCWTDNQAPLSHVINRIATVDLPLLKDLVLFQNFRDPEDYSPASPTSRFDMANLDRLDLWGVSLDWTHLSNLHLKLSNLSVYHLPVLQRPISLKAIYCLIKNASPHLRKLSLGGIGSQWDFQALLPTVPPILLPNIEQFSFQADGGGNPRCDLAYLTKLLAMFEFGPKLASLSLTRFFKDPGFDQLIPVLSTKFGRIEHLSIGNMLMTDSQFAHWLNVLPKLTSLSILGQEFQTIAFQTLSLPLEELGDFTTPVLCPLLRYLSPHSPHDGLVYLVIAARLEAQKPLRSIVWNIKHRGEVENSIYYPYLRSIVEMVYEGVA